MSAPRRCPFCGFKTITMWPMCSGGGERYESPVCERCGATIHENFLTAETTEAMLKAWNRRTSDSLLRQAREALRAGGNFGNYLDGGRYPMEDAIRAIDSWLEEVT